MSKFEAFVGNFIAGILILIFFFSIGTTFFNLLFRDGRDVGMYGNRGEFYMAE